jgi:peptidoglycan hydrolase-like protein with peptidoglycan-binding domain
MKTQQEWLFETPISLETDRLRKPDQEINWEASTAVLQSKQLQGDARLEAAANNNPPFHYDETGTAVKKLQQALVDAGYPMPKTMSKGTPDGIYRDETFKTIQKFQRDQKIKIDGIAGKDTLNHLDQLLLLLSPLPPPTPPLPSPPPPLPTPPTTPPHPVPPQDLVAFWLQP